MNHEKYHRDHQWRKAGLYFGPAYLVAEVVDVYVLGRPCNRFEVAAERASGGGGGYPC